MKIRIGARIEPIVIFRDCSETVKLPVTGKAFDGMTLMRKGQARLGGRLEYGTQKEASEHLRLFAEGANAVRNGEKAETALAHMGDKQ